MQKWHLTWEGRLLDLHGKCLTWNTHAQVVIAPCSNHPESQRWDIQ